MMRYSIQGQVAELHVLCASASTPVPLFGGVEQLQSSPGQARLPLAVLHVYRLLFPEHSPREEWSGKFPPFNRARSLWCFLRRKSKNNNNNKYNDREEWRIRPGFLRTVAKIGNLLLQKEGGGGVGGKKNNFFFLQNIENLYNFLTINLHELYKFTAVH